jgi:CheY-like chemotaxis protein
MPGSGKITVQVLLVEDSADDADLMLEALHEGNLAMCVTVLEDGEAALAFLRREGPYNASRRPDLILLDLHLPRKNGFEVLTEIKQDAELRRIPVVIMTSADSESAFVEAYNLHANCCVSKPVDQEEYTRAVRQIERFWLHVARRPS